MRSLKMYFSPPFNLRLSFQLAIGTLLIMFPPPVLTCDGSSLHSTLMYSASCIKLNEVTFCACEQGTPLMISLLKPDGTISNGCLNIIRNGNCPWLFEGFNVSANSLNTFLLNNTKPVTVTVQCAGVRIGSLLVQRVQRGNLENHTSVTVVGEQKQVSISFDGVPLHCYQLVNSTISVTDDSGSVYTVETISLTNVEVILSLPTDRYVTINNVTVVERDGEKFVLPSYSISLFDIQNLTANNCSMPNKVDVYLEYAKNTSAPGALVMLVPYNQNDSLDFTNAYYYILPRNLSSSYRRVSVSGGSFKVFAIDLENSIILRENTTAADTQIVTDVSGDEMNSTYPTDSEHIEVSMSGEGSVVVTCTDESKNSLVAVPLGRGSTRPNITNSHGGVVYLELDGANGLTSFVVFTWDKSGEFIDAVVSLVSTYVRPTEPTTTSSVVPQHTAGIIVGVVVPVMIVLVIIIVTAVTAVTAILTMKVSKNNKAIWNPNQPSTQSTPMDSPPGDESIITLASPSQVVTALNKSHVFNPPSTVECKSNTEVEKEIHPLNLMLLVKKQTL